MDLQGPLVADRDLGTGRHVAAVTHVLRKAAIDAARRRLAPANAIGNGIEDSEVFGMIHHKLAAKLKRILASRVRKLVHEAL